MMKKITFLLALSLLSYQSLASSDTSNTQPVLPHITETNASEEPDKKILFSMTFIGDASLSSIDKQAQEMAKKRGASHYKIIGASGENQLRGHVTFYQ
ncbi:DUF1471 domain-containing protein [Providencia sp. PROV260]|uniref:DUF1471 domain-containing protein n=2 Tax=Providencia TaxID=586 RepID=A0AAI9HWZ9_PROST|nr:DUF1471 domain-containing protein [Providencia sp. PROV260]ELR5034259.1 DUF1471 domain-containing protein [Providencia stuartii]